MPVCLIALGSNEGDRQANLEAAITEIGQQPRIAVLAVSRLYETAPIGGPPAQGRFLNGVLKIETSLAPQQLLDILQQVESRLGRRRPRQWAPRTLDLDLLLYDDLILNTPSLIVPHPRMAWRRFVLEPAAEVAAEMLHPTIGWTIGRLLEHLNAVPPYVAITGPIAAGKTDLSRRLSAAIPARLVGEQPDWPRLDAFYADPASHAWQIEMEFLRQRAELLALQHAAKPSSSPHWLISDFWFDQSLAFARAWLDTPQLPAFAEQFHRLRQSVVRPRLLVALDATTEELLHRIRHRGRPCERPLTRDQLDRIRTSLIEQIRQSDVGPVLHIADGDQAAALSEVLAAVRAME